MKIHHWFHALPQFVLLAATSIACAQVQPQLARQYFDEATRLCQRDAGKLWGVSLCGPMVIFDQATRTHAASQPEPQGPPPRFPGMADGPVSWGGARWFAFPLHMLAGTAESRQQIMLHGLFHRIQPELGFIADDGRTEHLDTLERHDEIREGLASYTEIAVWANTSADAHRAAAAELAAGDSQPSLVGNSEAASGPAYGVLLDDLQPGWRKQLRATSDLGDMLTAAINRPPATDLIQAAARYDGAALRAAEEARDQAQQLRVNTLRRRFVDGPVLTMPAAGSGTSDTTGSVGIPGVGTVLFRNFTLSARWGRLNANDGRLALCRWNHTLRPSCREHFEGTTLKGDHWSATLNPGWVVRPAARPGSFAIVPEN